MLLQMNKMYVCFIEIALKCSYYKTHATIHNTEFYSSYQYNRITDRFFVMNTTLLDLYNFGDERM